jgi:hypothetical protein
MEGWRQRRLGWTGKSRKNHGESKTLLTRIGLLMKDLGVGSRCEGQSNLRKAEQRQVQGATYNRNGGLGVTEFAPVAYPFSFQLRQQTAKGLLRVQ